MRSVLPAAHVMDNTPGRKGQWIGALSSNEFELVKYSH
jgi:hypothetical protein